jgi:hypothetical protein
MKKREFTNVRFATSDFAADKEREERIDEALKHEICEAVTDNLDMNRFAI